MSEIGPIGLILVFSNVIFSYRGLTNYSLLEHYKFSVDRILVHKEYKRLITSGFLHVSWIHLIFNMLSLYAFSGLLEYQLGGLYFTIIYFSGLLGGSLLALYLHRHHGNYSAVGASGAVCGVIFASIALFPGIDIGLFGLPFYIPGWLYGILYVAYSIYGIRSGSGNIGHEAHFGGAMAGMITALTLYPHALTENYLTIVIIFIPFGIFIYQLVTKPYTLLVNNSFFRSFKTNETIDHRYNGQLANRQKELDELLDKIGKNGLESLSAKEKKKLDEFSDPDA